MFVCAHYGAGVCLDFHCKDFAFGITKVKKKVPKFKSSSLFYIVQITWASQLDSLRLGKSCDVVSGVQICCTTVLKRPADIVTSHLFLWFPSMEKWGK